MRNEYIYIGEFTGTEGRNTMKKKAEYRSAIRSRKLIREAFLSLMEEEDFSKITVTAIVDRADINRGTFYAHYADTRAIVEEIEKEIIDQMVEVFRGFRYQSFFRDPLPILNKFSDWMQKDMESYRILIRSSGSGEFMLKLQRVFFEHMAADTTIPESIRNSPRFQLQVQFFASGTVSLYYSWFRGELDMTPEEISLEISRLIQSNADRIYEQSF